MNLHQWVAQRVYTCWYWVVCSTGPYSSQLVIYTMGLDKGKIIQIYCYMQYYTDKYRFFVLSWSLLLANLSDHWSWMSPVLPFQECQIVGIIQYKAFSNRFLFLNNIHNIFFYVLSCLDYTLVSGAQKDCFVWVYHSALFTHLLKNMLLLFIFWQLWVKLL